MNKPDLTDINRTLRSTMKEGTFFKDMANIYKNE